MSYFLMMPRLGLLMMPCVGVVAAYLTPTAIFSSGFAMEISDFVLFQKSFAQNVVRNINLTSLVESSLSRVFLSIGRIDKELASSSDPHPCFLPIHSPFHCQICSDGQEPNNA